MAALKKGDCVFIPLAGIGTLSLTRQEFTAALAAGAALAPPSGASASVAEPLLDAEQLAAQLNVPASWIEQAAREGRIPVLRFGRWPRFRRSDVEAAVRAARGNGT